jgi:hypothetical protein
LKKRKASRRIRGDSYGVGCPFDFMPGPAFQVLSWGKAECAYSNDEGPLFQPYAVFLVFTVLFSLSTPVLYRTIVNVRIALTVTVSKTRRAMIGYLQISGGIAAATAWSRTLYNAAGRHPGSDR